MGRRVLAVGLVLLGGCATPGAATLPSLMATRAASDRVKAAPEETQDGDGDGYADRFDVCPVVAGLAPDGCPERDSDGDGFLDSQDKCSEEPGVAPFGCPETNRDGDEFLDVVDRCLDDPGVEPDGCPIPDSDGDQILDPDDGCEWLVSNRTAAGRARNERIEVTILVPW